MIVYTPAEVKAGRVPAKQSFIEILQLLRTRLPDVKGVKGAIVAGSVLKGQHTRCSDCDCLVLIEREQAQQTRHSLAWFEEQAYHLYVPLAFTCITTRESSLRTHSITAGYYYYLTTCVPHGVVGENPLPRIYSQHLYQRDDLESYLRRKRAKVNADLIPGPRTVEQRVRSLARALSTPKHVVRKLLNVRNVEFEDSKAGMLAAIRGLSPKLADCFEETLILEDMYLSALEQQLSRFNPDRYEQTLLALKPGIALLEHILDCTDDLLFA